METAFSNYHPTVAFLYFTVIIVFSMLFMHPVFVGISLMTSITYSLILNGKKAVKLNLFFALPMFLLISIINPMVNHRGATILTYFRGNPLTKESIMYGVVSAAMMVSVIMWCSCYNVIITSDKIIYIFGKILPSIALMISMILRLIPKLIKQGKIIANSQRTLGFDCSSGNLIKRIKNCMRVLSILVSWALEDGVDTADSMSARGYGEEKRTTFSIFIFNRHDGIMMAFILIVTTICILGYVNGVGTLLFYPRIKPINFDFKSIITYVAFFAINSLTIAIEVLEDIKWKSLK